MIHNFEIIKGFDRIPPEKILRFSKSVTRGHNFKKQKQSCRLHVEKYFCANRVANLVNAALPTESAPLIKKIVYTG